MTESLYIPDLLDENENGVFGRHPVRAVLPVLVAPTNESRAKAFNTIRTPLVTVACAALKDFNFEFDSSFLGFKSKPGFTRLATLVRHYPGSPLSVFGHADPSGEDPYNKWLSERRARAVYALLIRDVDGWEALFDPKRRGLATGDAWGLASIQLMLQALGFPPGNTTGAADAATTDAIKAAQAAVIPLPPPEGGELPALPPTGKVDPATRRKLFTAYMNLLCQDERGRDFRLQRSDFLGEGKQAGAFQGCSEFNPQLLLSREEMDDFTKRGKEGKAERDAEHAPNRRVVIYLFAPGSRIDPGKWPCPAANLGPDGGTKRCIEHFWSNGKARRGTLFDQHRRRFGARVPASRAVLTPPNAKLAAELAHEETTFACRFYHGLALYSPCERDLRMWVLRLLADVPSAERARGPLRTGRPEPLADRRFVLRVGETPTAPIVRGRTTADGLIGVPFFDPAVKLLLKVDAYVELPPDPSRPPPSPPTGPGQGTLDSTAFPDEDRFVTLRLDGGALRRLRLRPGEDPNFDPDEPPPDRAERDDAIMQRLYNLGYGANEFPWDPEEQSRFLKRFQDDFDLEPEANRGQLDKVTDATLDRLAAEHEPRGPLRAP